MIPSFERTIFQSSGSGAEFDPFLMHLHFPGKIKEEFYIFRHELIHWRQHVSLSALRFIMAIQCLRSSIAHGLLEFHRQMFANYPNTFSKPEFSSIIPTDKDRYFDFTFGDSDILGPIKPLIPVQFTLKFVWRDLLQCERYFLHFPSESEIRELPGFLRPGLVFARAFGYLHDYFNQKQHILTDRTIAIGKSVIEMDEDLGPRENEALFSAIDITTRDLIEAMSICTECFDLVKGNRLPDCEKRFVLRFSSCGSKPFKYVSNLMGKPFGFGWFLNLIPIVSALCQEALDGCLPPRDQQPDLWDRPAVWYPPLRFAILATKVVKTPFAVTTDLLLLREDPDFQREDRDKAPYILFDMAYINVAKTSAAEGLAEYERTSTSILTSNKVTFLDEQFKKFDADDRSAGVDLSSTKDYEKDFIFVCEPVGEDPQKVSRFELFEYLRKAFSRKRTTLSIAPPPLKSVDEVYVGYLPPAVSMESTPLSRAYGWPKSLYSQFLVLNVEEYPKHELVLADTPIVLPEWFRFMPLGSKDEDDFVRAIYERYHLDVRNRVVFEDS